MALQYIKGEMIKSVTYNLFLICFCYLQFVLQMFLDNFSDAKNRLKKVSVESDGETTDTEKGRKRIPLQSYKENELRKFTIPSIGKSAGRTNISASVKGFSKVGLLIH